MLSGTDWPSIKRLQAGLHSGTVDAKKFGCTRHSVDIEVLALGALFAHELKYRVRGIRVLAIWKRVLRK